MDDATYHEETALTALCIWEHALENETTMDWLREGEGAWQARQNALYTASWIDSAWEKLEALIDIHGGGDSGSFDWEFVPYALSWCTTVPPECSLTVGFMETVARMYYQDNVDKKVS